jgi:hypothetical protein
MKKLLFIIAVLLYSIALQAQSEVKINQPYRFLKSPYVLLNTDTAATKDYVRTQSTHTGDATGGIRLTVVKLQGQSIATTIPTSGNALGWDGSAWTPAVATLSTYWAGNGISLSGTTFSGNYVAGTGLSLSTNTFNILYVAGTGLSITSNSFVHNAHTGDCTGITSLTVVKLLGRSLSTTVPTTGNVLKWDGTYWTPSAP